MILNEPIIRTLELQYKDAFLENWHNACINTIGTFEYHVTEGYWLFFETENYYATIGYDGVKTYVKPYEFPSDKYDWYSNGDEDLEDCFDTLLRGQMIDSVENHEEYQIVAFSSFKLHLYVHTKDDGFCFDVGTAFSGKNIMSIGGHLLKKCTCGGDAELLIDERSDFAVRCKECHKATQFDMELKTQIELWNKGDAPCVIDTGREILMNLLNKSKNIEYMALPSQTDSIEMIGDDSCYCTNLIIAFDGSYFLLTSQRINRNSFDFSGITVSGYNKDFWLNIIKPTEKFSFNREEEDCFGRKILVFELDDTELLIETANCELSVSLDEIKSLLNCGNLYRTTLFKK